MRNSENEFNHWFVYCLTNENSDDRNSYKTVPNRNKQHNKSPKNTKRKNNIII